MKTLKKFILPVSILAIVSLLAAWKLNGNKEKMSADASIANIKTVIFPVSITSPTLEEVTQTITESGAFNPIHELKLVSETSGRVTQILVRKGQYVTEGSVIATLDNEQLKIDLNLAEVTLQKNKDDMEKYKIMLAKNAINAQQVDDLKITIKNAESKLSSLRRQLKISNIKAPISGNINELNLEIGSYLSPGSAVAQIVNISSLKMEVMLLDKDIVRIKTGQKVTIAPDLNPNKSIAGTVTSIASIGDANRKFGVEITFSNKDLTQKAGMTGTAKFNFDAPRKALLIPSNCIVGSMQDAKVFVIEGDVAILKSIEIGNSNGNKIEVSKGLSTEDKVVLSGQLNIADGSKIQIIN